MPITGTVVRGSIVWVNLNPTKGHEQAGYRSAIVLSDGLIDESIADLAVLVPVISSRKGYSFEVEVPKGIHINGSLVGKPELTILSGAALTMHTKSIDLSARNAAVIGQVDVNSEFFIRVISIVRAILA
ncbi:type II toxin-antitoxin system PemK/MazF family toxin [Paenibacillus lemnae]|uniref:mRNA-degrading endonuclease n=1 Tax=Paenibacillus lemnae TaxID=1330551 RepID=A0A848M868_PAELE|nr:type II toxin-antitoxin system PemK/MazF family toxin [Paenibacillus lemnae]NMO96459.1 mRNA-degrading endonuclease [Paenibacillus lemnae]